MKATYGLICTAVGAGLLLGGCVNRAAQQQAKRTEDILADTTKPVMVTAAVNRPLVERLEITGEIATAADVRVAAKTPGKLVAVYVADGDKVSAGQILARQDTSSQEISLRQAQAQVTAMQASLSQAIANARIAPSRTAAAVASAEAQLRSAKAQRDKVRSGARPEERRQADAQLDAARSNLETARKELERQRSLYDSGATSRQRLEQAENAFRAAEASYESANQQVQMMKSWAREEDIRSAEEAVKQAEAAVRSAKANRELDVLLLDQVQAAKAQIESARAQLKQVMQSIDDASIKAPISGTIYGVPAQAGQSVGGGEPVARIVGTGGVYFEGEVPETTLSNIRVGNAVGVTLEAIPGKTFRGRVAAISPAANSVGRLFTVKVVLDGAPLDLKPGMFGAASVEIRQIAQATVVPAGAVVRRAGQDMVFVVEGNVVKKRLVTTGIKSDGQIQVSGVNPGEQVVTTGQTEVDEGSKVRVDKPVDRKDAKDSVGG